MAVTHRFLYTSHYAQAVNEKDWRGGISFGLDTKGTRMVSLCLRVHVLVGWQDSESYRLLTRRTHPQMPLLGVCREEMKSVCWSHVLRRICILSSLQRVHSLQIWNQLEHAWCILSVGCRSTQWSSSIILRKDRNTVICKIVDEPGGHYIKWNKPDTEKKVTHGLIYMWY